MENSTIKLNGEEYRFDIGSNNTKLTISVEDNYCLSLGNYGSWWQCKAIGNEMTFIIENNLSNLEREDDIYVYSSKYPDKNAFILLAQKGEEYSITSDNTTKTDMSPLIDGEDFKFKLTVKGGNQKCIIKEIKEYCEMSTNDYLRIPFDNSLTANIESTADKGIYELTVHNSGKVTENVSYFDIALIHDNNSSTTLNIRLSYKDISKSISVSPNILDFKSNGFISNNIIKLKGNHIDNITENITNSLDWLHLSYGYDCIYAYVEANDSVNSRNGVITVYDNTITIKQEGKVDINDLMQVNNDFIQPVIVNEIEYREGIDNVSIRDNRIKLQTNTFINENYVHDSMVTVSLSGKWADFLADYDIDAEMHIITIKAESNPFDTERRCTITIRNAENTEASQRFLLIQQPLSENITLSLIND